MISLPVNRIEEPQARDNFKTIELSLNDNPFSKGTWKHFELSFPAAGTFTVKHNLGFKPKDILTTYSSSAVTFGYSGATAQNITVTTTTATTVRFIIGGV